MNQRLKKTYMGIEDSNKEDFLANNLSIDNQWEKAVWGIALQIQLSNEVKDLICKIQKDLEELEPGNVLSLPREFQHISFNQVIFWNGEYQKGKKSPGKK